MMEELRDIKGLVAVPDYSLYYLLGVVVLGLILLLIIGTLLYRRVTRKRVPTQREVAIGRLKSFAFDDAKESVYAFSHLAQYAVSESQREVLEKLLARLEPYKYRKEVPELDDELKAEMQRFIEELGRG